jgi:argonaute-like protein implicated in RNA metabolism and viral defense
MGIKNVQSCLQDCNCEKQVRIKSVTQGCKHAASVNHELNKHSICYRYRLSIKKIPHNLTLDFSRMMNGEDGIKFKLL